MKSIELSKLFLDSYAKKEKARMDAKLSMIDSRIGCFSDGMSRSNRGTVALSHDFNAGNAFGKNKVFGKGKAADLYCKLEKTMNVDVDLYNLDHHDDSDCLSGSSYSVNEETVDPEIMFGIAPSQKQKAQASAQDMFFPTEIDHDTYIKADDRDVKTSMTNGQTNANASTRMEMTSGGNDVTTQRHHLSSVAEKEEMGQINHVLKQLMAKEHPAGLYFEEVILDKKKKLNASRGWKRATGAKTAPMKLLL